VESEIAFAARREQGSEAVFSVEQVASTLRWTRAGYYDQHVVGDRARQTGFTFAVLALARSGWAIPVLYGNRLRPRRAREDSASGRRGRRARGAAADTAPVVHPLADDRDRYYRYAGGDTVVTIAAGDRRVPIVRVLVEPRPGLPAGTGLFRGELDLDVTRHVLVRMRGRYLVAPAGAPVAPARLVRALRPRAFAYVELVNAERADARGGRYWLPAYQRVEVQLATPALGDARVVARLVSRFRDVAVNDTVLPAADLAVNADSILRRERRRLTRAPADSLGRYAGWRTSLGDATGGAHADDFADVGPAALAPAGPPRGEFFVPRASDFFHFNRVDGPYLGAGARTRFRDLAPGLTLTATAGWAGGARTARGRVELAQRFGAGARAADAPGAAPGAGWTLALRAGRSLDLTNDFRTPLDSGSSFGALLGADLYDYVDRRSAGLALARTTAAAGGPAGARRWWCAPRPGWPTTRGDSNNVRRAPVGGFRYRPNRGVDAGRYVRTALTVEWHPDVAAEFVRPGAGARLYVERGDAWGAPGAARGGGAGLGYTRVEGRLTGRPRAVRRRRRRGRSAAARSPSPPAPTPGRWGGAARPARRPSSCSSWGARRGSSATATRRSPATGRRPRAPCSSSPGRTCARRGGCGGWRCRRRPPGSPSARRRGAPRRRARRRGRASPGSGSATTRSRPGGRSPRRARATAGGPGSRPGRRCSAAACSWAPCARWTAAPTGSAGGARS
jgi:hypothetical protein